MFCLAFGFLALGSRSEGQDTKTMNSQSQNTDDSLSDGDLVLRLKDVYFNLDELIFLKASLENRSDRPISLNKSFVSMCLVRDLRLWRKGGGECCCARRLGHFTVGETPPTALLPGESLVLQFGDSTERTPAADSPRVGGGFVFNPAGDYYPIKIERRERLSREEYLIDACLDVNYCLGGVKSFNELNYRNLKVPSSNKLWKHPA